MGHYRKVHVRIWNDEKFRALSLSAKLVFIFLLTHPNMTMLGAMRGTLAGLAGDLEQDPDQFDESFDELFRKGMVKYDPANSIVVLPHWLRYNRPESPNVIRAWPVALEKLPECEYKNELIAEIKRFAGGLTLGLRKAFDDTKITQTVLAEVRRKAASKRWVNCCKTDANAMQTACKADANAMQAGGTKLKTKDETLAFAYQEQEQEQEQINLKTLKAPLVALGNKKSPPPDENFALTSVQSPKTKKSSAKVKDDPENTAAHVAVRAHILMRYEEHNAGLKAPWGAGSGQQLKLLMKKTPSWLPDVWMRCIDNRFASDVNPSEDPIRWIKLLPDYQKGPLDRFGKPPRNGGSNGRESIYEAGKRQVSRVSEILKQRRAHREPVDSDRDGVRGGKQTSAGRGSVDDDGSGLIVAI